MDKLKPNTVYKYEFHNSGIIPRDEVTYFSVKAKTDENGVFTDEWNPDWYTKEELIECAFACADWQADYTYQESELDSWKENEK